VLYHDCIFSKSTFSRIPTSLLTQLADHLGSYIDRINSYSSEIAETSLLAAIQTTQAASDADTIIGQHPVMLELLFRTDQVSPSEAPVLIQGETGVGKELLARRIHRMSPRRDMPFIALNLTSIPETLLESELFGHEKGAFTGAVNQKPGLMELANKGTLFIDEVGEIPKSIQVKMLRVLQEKSFSRVGGIRQYSSDFRIVAATNRRMAEEVTNGNFREDLYYRLNVVPLFVPPLRERGDDIVDLAEYFLAQYGRKYNRSGFDLTEKDRNRLKAYHWPGNVRELANIIERATILTTSEKLDFSMLSVSESVATSVSTEADELFKDNPTLDEIQRRYIKYILKETDGVIGGSGGAAEILGINRTTLYSRMKKLGISQ